jgi:hypothetical protein
MIVKLNKLTKALEHLMDSNIKEIMEDWSLPVLPTDVILH